MFTPDQYQLLDFGDGRRLERFGQITLDRPCPAAEGVAQSDPVAWRQADARFDRSDGDEGRWTCRRKLPEQWEVRHGTMRLELKCTDFGHLGVFPEQADNWLWIAEQIRRFAPQTAPLRVLNLFAYTGGSTLATAAAGAEVVHVDAARNTVAWARRNAARSGLAEAPIRWIAEDAMKFVQRELRRGNSYDAVVLDPPSYGHGAHGEVWRLAEHLPPLLRLCGQLTALRRRFLLLTCHTPGFEPPQLRRMLADSLEDSDRGTIDARPLFLRTAAGRELPSGAVVRWEAETPSEDRNSPRSHGGHGDKNE
jgi:23S rRNA (cytosine1962-C5)-methyltransferase